MQVMAETTRVSSINCNCAGAAYVGKELQIFDDGRPAYASIGEWNQQEMEVKGDRINITLNGTVVIDGGMKKASENGTIDKHDHPGLNRHLWHISFLGT